MSDSVWPHRQQPTRLHPWDSPGKNTGVGCPFLLQCVKVKSKVKSLSLVRLLATPWTAYQAPPSMGFSRQEYWSGVPLPSPYTNIEYSYFLTSNEHFSKIHYICLSPVTLLKKTTEIWCHNTSPQPSLASGHLKYEYSNLIFN